MVENENKVSEGKNNENISVQAGDSLNDINMIRVSSKFNKRK